MGLKLVIERECSRDHQTALRQFLCCEPGGPEWAMDPQRYIRDLSVRKTPKGIMRTLLVVSGDIPLHDDVVGFCEYGVAVETTDEHEGVYQISYIATALKVRGTHLGDTLLSSVIVRLRDDAWRCCVVIPGVKALYRLFALVEVVCKHMVDVGGQRKPVMPDYTGYAHDAVVILRAHVCHLPLACLYFGFTDEKPFIVLFSAFAAYRHGRQDFHTRLHLGKQTSAVMVRTSVFLILFLIHIHCILFTLYTFA